MHLAGCLREMGYHSCLVDPNLWLKGQTDWKEKKYYSYIICYVDYLLVVHHNPKRVMDKINNFLPLKPDSVGPPEMYLRAKLKKEDLRGWHLGLGPKPGQVCSTSSVRMLGHTLQRV